MPNPNCVADKDLLDKHGCHYVLSGCGLKLCGSPCVHVLIKTIESLKSENEELKRKLVEMKAEL